MATSAEAAAGSNAGNPFREARQVAVLLATLRASLTAPRPRVPPSVAVFLAEAATAAANPTSFLYPIVNKFLLRNVMLPLRGLPLFQAMHAALGPDWRRCRAWAHALALAAPAVHSARRTLLAEATAAVAGAGGEAEAALAAVRVYVECVARASGAPAAAAELITSGELACLVPLAEWLLGVACARVAKTAALIEGATGHTAASAGSLATAELALSALLQMSRVARVWRADMADAAAVHFGSALVTCAPRMRALGNDGRTVALRDTFWALLQSVLRGARAWRPRRAAALGLHAAFWRSLCHTVAERGQATAAAALAECLSCVSPAALWACERAASRGPSLGHVLPEAVAAVCARPVPPAGASGCRFAGPHTARQGVRICAWLLACALQRGAISGIRLDPETATPHFDGALEQCGLGCDARGHAAGALVRLWVSGGGLASHDELLLFLACGLAVGARLSEAARSSLGGLVDSTSGEGGGVAGEEQAVQALMRLAAGAESLDEGLTAAAHDCHADPRNRTSLRDVLVGTVRRCCAAGGGACAAATEGAWTALHAACESAASWLL